MGTPIYERAIIYILCAKQTIYKNIDEFEDGTHLDSQSITWLVNVAPHHEMYKHIHV